MKTTHPITSTNPVKAKAPSQAVAKSHSLRMENLMTGFSYGYLHCFALEQSDFFKTYPANRANICSKGELLAQQI